MPFSYGVYIKHIWFFLTDRQCYVTVAGERSAERGVPSGVPQGAVLSPTLFNIFTSDFPTLTDVQLAHFADDSALFSTHAKADVVIDRIQSALNTWKTKLNPSKTQAVFFTKRRTRELPSTYLELILDKLLTFSPNFNYVSDRVQKLTHILYLLIKKFRKKRFRRTHSNICYFLLPVNIFILPLKNQKNHRLAKSYTPLIKLNSVD
jgi:hypothetical protein